MGRIKPIDFETCTIYNGGKPWWKECWNGRMVRLVKERETYYGYKRFVCRIGDQAQKSIRKYDMPISVPYSDLTKLVLNHFDDHGEWPWEGRGTKWKQKYAKNAGDQCKAKRRSSQECQLRNVFVHVEHIRL
jgi:hypothetical protein